MNIDELFVANQKEGNGYLTTCFDEQTSFTPKVHAFAIVKNGPISSTKCCSLFQLNTKTTTCTYVVVSIRLRPYVNT